MASETTKAELADDFRAAGFEGRHVMIHSSYRVLRPVEGGPQGVVDATVEAVGDEGVLLFPTYDFQSFTERGYWDRQNTTSKMGAISETARLDERFVRTRHPILSYACTPSMAFVRLIDLVKNHVGHGKGSVFDALVQMDGLLVSFSGKGFKEGDVGFTASTHAMCEAKVPYRFVKYFNGKYVDHGHESVRTYAASVCASGYRTAVTPAHEEAEREGIIKRHKLGRTEMIVADARDFHEWALEACVKRPELFRRKVD